MGDKTDSNWCCCLRSLSYLVNYCMSGRAETGVRVSLSVCVCVCVLFDRR